MSILDLANMVRHRQLIAGDQVKQGKSGAWTPARTIQGLFQDDGQPAKTDGDEVALNVQREATRLEARIRGIAISPHRDGHGKLRIDVRLVDLDADANDLAGSIVREMRRRLDELEATLRSG